MRKDKQVRQGLKRSEWSNLANSAQADGLSLSQKAEELLTDGLKDFKKPTREYPTYRCINLSEETYSKIMKISKKLNVKKSEIIRKILTGT